MTTALNETSFRAQFAAFSDTTKYPSATVSLAWTTGTDFISQNNGVYNFNAAQAQEANDLMCAHILYINTAFLNGQSTGVLTGAAEGTVNVTFMPPPVKSAFQYWLASSPYGQQLRALLRVVSAGGMLIGGSCERQGYRKIGGVF